MIATKEWFKSLLKKAKDNNLFVDLSESFIQNLCDIYVNDKLYYKKGETITVNNSPMLFSVVSNSTKDYTVMIPLQKRLDKISTITCTSFKANVRRGSGYLFDNAFVTGGVDIYNAIRESLTITKIADINMIKVTFRFSSTIYGGTNNTFVISEINEAKFTLN